VADFNNDGVKDVAIGSPFAYHEDGSAPLAGKVEIFFLNGTI
jgi:FG-GAP repeat